MLFDQISTDIMSAMKAHDKVRTQALRNVKKYFIEAKTAPGSNGELTDEAAMKILAKLAKQGRDTAALYTEQNRPDLAWPSSRPICPKPSPTRNSPPPSATSLPKSVPLRPKTWAKSWAWLPNASPDVPTAAPSAKK